MPPKQAKSGNKSRVEETKDDPLQAVVVADTFETKFAPFTLERPRCLLPLANVPVIEYTLEYLASAGVQEIFFYAGAHIEQVETYLEASKWMSSASPFGNIAFLRCMATSVGDVMRDLDQKHLLTGDFICVSGDIVSDFPIHKALREHKIRREKDKNAIMTMLLKERLESDQQYDTQILPTFVIDPSKDRCLHYEESRAGSSFAAHIDPEILKTPEIDIRQDLIDCRIDICTPDMLSLWSDNFDNQKPRKDFLFGVLKDYELNGKTIHTYIIKDHYANRLEDPTSYVSTLADLENRLSLALSLDNNVSGSRYKRQRNGTFKEDEVIVQRPTRLAHGTIVGEGTSIGANTEIRKSVLGRRCQIGKSTNIETAYIWDDVTIGNNVTITRAIIGSEVFVGDKATIGEGSLISYGVKIAPGTIIPAGSRITVSQRTVEGKANAIVVGRNGKGQEYEPEDEEDARYPLPTQFVYQRHDLNESVSSLASDQSEISGQLSREGSRAQSFATQMSDDEGTDRFLHDTVYILTQRMQEDKHVDDMQSELMGLRFSGGADETQVRKAVATALVKHIHSQNASAGLSAERASRSTLEKYRFLIKRENAEQSVDEQVAFLLDVQRDLAHRADGSRLMPFIVKDLYDLEVLEEESFTKWYDDGRSKEPEVIGARDAAKPFIDWLAAADDSDDDSDEDEDEEEDDEDEDDD